MIFALGGKSIEKWEKFTLEISKFMTSPVVSLNQKMSSSLDLENI